MNRKLRLGIIITCAFVLMSTIGPMFVQDPQAFSSTPLSPPDWNHLLGTNGQGQDVLAQTVVGAQVTLSMALIISCAVVFLGAFIG